MALTREPHHTGGPPAFVGHMRKRPAIIVAAILLLATAVAFAALLWNHSNNLTTAGPPFDKITLPLRKIEGDIWMDGGSVWVGVEDAKGASYHFIFPYDYVTQGYPRALHTTTPPKRIEPDDAVTLPDPARARAIVLGWLRRAEHRDDGLDRSLDYLSGYAHSMLRRVRTHGIGELFK